MKVVHVAVGVIQQGSRFLLAKRADHQHQGGLWEFPGGKVEAGEAVQTALVRELQEELSITATQFQPLIQIRHDYGDKCVLLDVWTVTAFVGEPKGCEGQPLEWVAQKQLPQYAFPAANQPIVDAICLPKLIAIMPSDVSFDEALSFIESAKQHGAQAIQLRCPRKTQQEMTLLYRAVCQRLSQNTEQPTKSDISLVMNSEHCLVNGQLSIEPFPGLTAIHVKSKHIPLIEPLRYAHPDITIYAACHSLEELKQAQKAAANAALLSPILPTGSHPGQQSLGWDTFNLWVSECTIPVYALGGMEHAHIEKVKKAYGQGIAGISFFQK